jgi:hypothetical protein
MSGDERWRYDAREDIRDLVARYNLHGDAGRFEAQAEVFAEDGVLVMDTPDDPEPLTLRGRTNIRQAIAEVGRRWAKEVRAAGGEPFVRHFVSTHVIDIEDRDNASGRAYALVLFATGLDHWGYYTDRYVREDGVWRIAHRKAHTEGRVPRGGPEHRDPSTIR